MKKLSKAGENMNDKSKLHSGHRERMRKRFKASNRSFKSFSEHEVLEMLLYNCYKRQNTNEIAHDLINRFGSVKNVMTASVDELCKVKNVNRAVAANLRFYGELYMYLLRGEQKPADICDIAFMDEYLTDALANKDRGLYVISQSGGTIRLHACGSEDLFPVKMQLLSDRADIIVTAEYIARNSLHNISAMTPVINELSDFCSANGIEYGDHYIFSPPKIRSLKESDMF